MTDQPLRAVVVPVATQDPIRDAAFDVDDRRDQANAAMDEAGST